MTFGRRSLLKVGVAAATTGLLKSVPLEAQVLLPQIMPPDAVVRPSPPTTPFLAPLQIPQIAQPIDPSVLNPPPDPAKHQRYEEFPPQKFYIIRERQFMHQYHPELKPTPSWGYNAAVPGHTFHARYGEPILIRRFNELPADHVGFGLPSTTMHLHNFHSASESDGFPMDFIPSGGWWDHHYAMYPSGGDPRQRLNTLWYHDHRMDFTSSNVYAGFSAFFLIFDDQDTGNENDPSPQAWRLPSGKYDVPMILHDVLFHENGHAAFDAFRTDGMLGDKPTVNRIVQPHLKVEPRKYRFRIVNGGPSRFYQYFLSTGQPFVVISSDGNILPAPVEVESLRQAVAERNDVIIDFSRYQPGDEIIMYNRLEQESGAGPSGRLVEPGTPIIRFDVVPLTAPDNSRVPEKLRELPPYDLNEVVRERMWTFDYRLGQWTINGQTADMSVSSADVKLGTSEIWTFRNEGSTWSHPVHVHFEEFRILERNHQPIEEGTIYHGRKDVLWLGPNEIYRVLFKWRDFHGKYVIHCHNVVHEDHAMMLRYDVVP